MNLDGKLYYRLGMETRNAGWSPFGINDLIRKMTRGLTWCGIFVKLAFGLARAKYRREGRG
jgi:hypothetical protein